MLPHCLCTVLPAPTHPQMRRTGRKMQYSKLVGSSSEHRTKAVLLLPHSLKAQPVRAEARFGFFWKCWVEHTHFSAIIMGVVQSLYTSPASLGYTFSEYQCPELFKFPLKTEGARTWGWEGKADLHRKAMKVFGSSAQPDSMLSYLSDHIYSVTIMKLTLLSQWVRVSDRTNFLG